MQAISVLTVPHFIYSLPAKFTKHPKTLGRQFDKKIIILDQGETPLHDIQLYFDKYVSNCNSCFELVDVTNKKEIEHVFETYKPDIVFAKI